MSCGSAKEMNEGSPLPPLFLHHITHLEKGSAGILAKSGFRDSLPPGTQGTGLGEKVGTSLRWGGVQWLRFHDPNAGDPGFHP